MMERLSDSSYLMLDLLHRQRPAPQEWSLNKLERVLAELVNAGLIERTGETIRITDKGLKA